MQQFFMLVTTAAVLSIAPLASAQLASDSFDYPDGALIPNGGWANQSGTAGTLTVANGEVVLSQDSGSEDGELVFGDDIATGTITAAFDIRVEDTGGNGITGTDFEYFAHFSDDTTFNFVARVDVVAPNGATGYTLGIATFSGTNEAKLPVDFAFGDTVPVELSFNLDTGLASVTAGGSTVSSTTVALGELVDAFNLRQSNSSSDETIYLDNLVITPEPASLALLGLGGLFALRRRRN